MTPDFSALNTAFILFFGSLILAIIAARLALITATKLDLIDYPGSLPHKKHEHPTALGGGLMLFFMFAGILLIFRIHFSTQVHYILLASLVVFAFSLTDDLRKLSPLAKFLGQIAATLILIFAGVQVHIINFWGGPTDEVLNLVITALWIVGITNAFNLVDSMDGVATSLVLSTSLFLLLGAGISGQADLAYQAVILIAFTLIFLFYNLTPARMFLGDSGTQTLGFMLASFLILYNPRIQPIASSWFVPITFVAIPVFDVVLVVVSRWRRKVPIYRAELTHTYHRLAALGLSPARAIWSMAIASILYGSAGLYALYQEPRIANSIFGFLLLMASAAIYWLEFRQPLQKQT